MGVLFVWVLALTVYVVKMVRHYRGLSSRTGEKSIDKILDALMSTADQHHSHIESLGGAIQELDDARHGYFQKYGYVRFNPFQDRVGGDQSFVIALLDNKNNGIVQTCMYTREGMRMYVKRVTNGTSTEYELSQEEKEAIKNAQ